MSVRSAIKTMMRAIRVTEFGGPQVLKVETNVPVPRPSEDQVYNTLCFLNIYLKTRPILDQCWNFHSIVYFYLCFFLQDLIVTFIVLKTTIERILVLIESLNSIYSIPCSFSCSYGGKLHYTINFIR